MKKSFITLCAVAALAVPAGAQTVVLSDDFESYADSAAVAAVWTGLDTAQYTLQSAAGEGAEGSDQWLNTTGTGSNKPTRSFTGVTASDTDPVALSFYTRADLFAGTRSGISLRGAATNPYLHLGTNNGSAANAWAIRMLNIPGHSDNYYYLENGPARPTGEWVKLGYQVSASALRFFMNDVEIESEARVLTAAPAEFSTIHIGYGNSHNQAVDYDSIVVEHGENASVNDWDLY